MFTLWSVTEFISDEVDLVGCSVWGHILVASFHAQIFTSQFGFLFADGSVAGAIAGKEKSNRSSSRLFIYFLDSLEFVSIWAHIVDIDSVDGRLLCWLGQDGGNADSKHNSDFHFEVGRCCERLNN
jgi:hypothetical protein